MRKCEKKKGIAEKTVKMKPEHRELTGRDLE